MLMRRSTCECENKWYTLAVRQLTAGETTDLVSATGDNEVINVIELMYLTRVMSLEMLRNQASTTLFLKYESQ
jgi:hypothetical protein